MLWRNGDVNSFDAYNALFLKIYEMNILDRHISVHFGCSRNTAIIFQICMNDFYDKKYRFDLIFCSTTSVHFPTEEKNYRRDSNLYLSSLNLRLIFNCFQRRNITCIEQRILTYHMYSVPCIDQLCHLSFSCLELHTF